MAGCKVASADFTNHDLLTAMARTAKPLIASTGMSSEAEIIASVALLRQEGASFALLHCNSTYPAPYKDVNLAYMNRLKELGDCPVGYSGHERGWFVPVAAIALGASVIEKHFTVDRAMEGNDHRVSLLPDELRAMVEAIRATEQSMGTAAEREVTQGEMMNREVLAKSLHAATDIAPGTVITHAHILVRSPGQGLQPNQREALVGRTATRAIRAGTPFFPTDIEDRRIEPRAFAFARPWGIPVRYHDYRAMLDLAPLPFLEYHLSYKDMDEDLRTWFDAPLPISFAVHAPELFAGDHVLDLASPDEAYRAHSIAQLQRVIDVTRALKPWHQGPERPVIVTNMGGFNAKGFLPREERAALYDRIVDSLSRLDSAGVEIIPQTMPPFPWHFGGQSHHNLFMDPDEIVAFCMANDMRVCLDLSHSQLACNHFGWSMSEFCRKVGRYAAHLHVVDAKGVDGEGLQIGEGHMDFAALAQILDETCPQASFIPEIWQGHKNGGAGFWQALDALEPWFGSASPRSRPDPDDRSGVSDRAGAGLWADARPGRLAGASRQERSAIGRASADRVVSGGWPPRARVARVLCSTDDDAIAQAARIAGADVPFLRPAALPPAPRPTSTCSPMRSNGWRRPRGACPNSSCNCAPTQPFREAGWIDEALARMKADPAITCIRTIAPAPHTPYKMWLADDAQRLSPLLTLPGVAEPFNMPRQSLPTVYWHTGQLDVIRTRTLLQGSMTGEHIEG
jgi:sugar phosphate isomerase/epimerase/CMP-N-acetylneuraminic acid synthetase